MGVKLPVLLHTIADCTISVHLPLIAMLIFMKLPHCFGVDPNE